MIRIRLHSLLSLSISIYLSLGFVFAADFPMAEQSGSAGALTHNNFYLNLKLAKSEKEVDRVIDQTAHLEDWYTSLREVGRRRIELLPPLVAEQVVRRRFELDSEKINLLSESNHFFINEKRGELFRIWGGQVVWSVGGSILVVTSQVSWLG